MIVLCCTRENQGLKPCRVIDHVEHNNCIWFTWSNLGNSRFTERTSTDLKRSHRLPRVLIIFRNTCPSLTYLTYILHILHILDMFSIAGSFCGSYDHHWHTTDIFYPVPSLHGFGQGAVDKAPGIVTWNSSPGWWPLGTETIIGIPSTILGGDKNLGTSGDKRALKTP